MKNDILRIAALKEKLGSLPNQQKVLVLILTVGIMAGGFYFLKYQEQDDQIKRLRSSLTTQEKKLAELKSAAARVEVLKVELAKSEEEFSKLLTLLPDQKEIPGLLESVSQLGAQVGLENILFQPQPEQAREFYAAIPVRLDLVGSYHELGTFFDSISKLNRILKVESLSMTRQSHGSASTLQVNCTIVTYRFIEKGEPVAGAPQKK